MDEESEIPPIIFDCVKLCANRNTFAALRRCGEVLLFDALGDLEQTVSVSMKLINIRDLRVKNFEFHAVRENGEILSWV